VLIARVRPGQEGERIDVMPRELIIICSALGFITFIPVPSPVQGFFHQERIIMETRIALVGIIVENQDSVQKINDVLHEYREYIVGRMGIPYHKRNISVISIVIDAPCDVVSALSGKLGMIPHVNTKTVYSKIPSEGK